jgi:hypothetical protein
MPTNLTATVPPPSAPPGAWLGIVRAVRSAILLALETAVLVTAGVWVLVGLVKHARATRWELSGLLTMLHDQWRGAVILAALIFYVTIREGLDRLKLRSLKTPFGDFAMRRARKLETEEEEQT